MTSQQNRQGYLFSKRYSSYVFILLFLLYVFDYADRMVVNSMFSFIRAEYGTTDTQNGWLVSVIYLAIGILTFPISLVIDRWSRTKTIGIMAIVWSLATAACAFTGNYVQLFMARILIGFGEAGYAPGGTALISGMYPLEKRSRMMGFWNASIPIGSAIGVTMGGIIASSLGWKHAFGLVAIPGLIIAVLFLFVKDYKTVDLSYVDKANNRIKMERKDMFREFLSRPSVLFTYFGMAAIVFVTTALIVWLPTYFASELNMEPKLAGTLAGAVMLLALVGAPLGGHITDKWREKQANARLLFPTISTIISALVLFIALFLMKGTAQVIVLFIFGAWVMTFLAGAAAVTQDVIHPGMRATSYAIAVAVQNLLGSFTAPIVLGKISDLSNIRTAISILPFVLLIGTLLFFLGSKYYVRDMEKVAKIKLEAAE
ncbi:MAG: MFS transporter [Bacteroidales bacterium]|nr:MFS transporter [Bacteroidales bacterium]MBN2634495.1 MFS transporter [Bacteroidales bacterium]